jgi:predicted Fe-Mo cluster-binding NifX family protein
MKIAIPASGQTIHDPVDSRFGRAPYIILISPDNGESTVLPNPYAQESGGVGPRLVQLLVQNQVTHLIVPRVGGNAETAIIAAGILVFSWEGSGSVTEALDLFKAGKLSLIEGKKRAF